MPSSYDKMSDRLLEKVVNGVFGGQFAPDRLPPDLYNEILDRLTDAIFEGFGEVVGDDDAGLMVDMFRNVNVFSAAKTHQQIKDMSAHLFDADGVKNSFSKFKKEADGIFEQYNKHWLETEFNTAVSQAQAGKQWLDIERDADALPILKRVSAGDDRVRDRHKSLDGVVRRWDDPFWDKYMPPDDWACRCTIIQLEEGEEELTDIDGREFDEPSPLFAHNPAKSRYIFDESKDGHPYFKVEERYQNVKVDGVPIVPQPKEPVEIPDGAFKSPEAAKAYLMQEIKRESGLNVKSIALSSNFSPLETARRVNTLAELFKEYKLDGTTDLSLSKPRITFKSGARTLGVVKAAIKRDDRRFYLTAMNFGDRAGAKKSLTYVKGETSPRWSCRVDEDNVDISTTVHEFAHTVTMSDAVFAAGVKQETRDFWRELGTLRKEYFNELNGKIQAGDLTGRYDMHLGRYSETNVDEFLAEGFTEYRLSSNPSKYATKIGQLFDKYYKKK